MLVLALGLVTAACGDDDSAADPSTGTSGGTVTGGPVVLVTHDSFSLPKKLVKQFEADTGYELELRSNGDAGSMTSQLVLNVDNPLGDVAFGVDNTFAGRALEEHRLPPDLALDQRHHRARVIG